jgi:cytochrome c biogenesis protein
VRGAIVLEPGQTADSAELSDGSKIPLGFEITLDRFTVEFYRDHPGRPKSYVSAVTVTEPGTPPYQRDIRVNHPLMLHGVTVYQSSYGESESEFVQSAAGNDTVTVAVSLKAAPDGVPPIATFAMTRGSLYTVPGFGDSIQIGVSEIFRDFKRVQSVSGETNPAVFLDVVVHGEIRWQVYAFQRFPGLNMPMADDLDLVFTMQGLSGGAETAEDKAAEYYTVLGVVRDRGIPLMWLGAVLMIAGLFLSFYIRPRRIWALDDGGRILIGGSSKGNTTDLKNFIERTVSSLDRH